MTEEIVITEPKGEPIMLTFPAPGKEWSVEEYVTRDRRSTIKFVKAERPEDQNHLVIGSDLSVRIPSILADKLGWKAGTELWAEIYDENLNQIIFGESNLMGEKAKTAIQRLRKIMIERRKRK